jgi:hypothetical protein
MQTPPKRLSTVYQLSELYPSYNYCIPPHFFLKKNRKTTTADNMTPSGMGDERVTSGVPNERGDKYTYSIYIIKIDKNRSRKEGS